MKNMMKWYVVLALLLASGCAHLPETPVPRNQLSASVVSGAIVKGETTKKEILARLGAPNSVVKQSRLPAQGTPEGSAMAESWNYWTSPPLEALGQGGVFQVFRLTVSFDAAGVARDYHAEEKTVKME